MGIACTQRMGHGSSASRALAKAIRADRGSGFHHGIFHRARTHPAQGQKQQHHRQQKGHHAHRLQHQVRRVGANQADPVVRRPSNRGIGRRIQRAVQGRVGGQGQQHQHGRGNQQDADQLIEPLALRGNKQSGENRHSWRGGRRSDTLNPARVSRARSAVRSTPEQDHYDAIWGENGAQSAARG